MAVPSAPLTQSVPKPTGRGRRLTPVQLAAAGSVVACFVALSPAQAAIASVATAALVVIAASDLRHRLVPNRVVLPATAGVLALRAVLRPDSLATSVLAALALALALAIPRLVRNDAIGMGDVKLGLLIGATLGWAGFGALAIAFLAMFPFAVVTLARGGRTARNASLPFAPFLAFGTLILLFGSALGL
jgi:leader peptidase (prepilin peptidase) / N-methyltransferase